MRIPDPMQFPVQPSAQAAAAFMGTGESIPVLIVNTDPANTINIGYRNQSKIGDRNTVLLLPGQSVVMDGSRTIYVIGPQGTNDCLIIPGGTSFFQPTTLSGIGGAKVFVQGTTPTQPPTIPLNSIWFDTANGSLQTWNGSAWVNQQFNAQQLIQAASILATQIASGTLTTTQLAAAAGILGSQIASATITSGNIAANTIVAANIAANTITAAQIAANTITAGQIAANTITAAQIAANTITVSQLAAGIIYAGIVDGTTIVGGVFRAKNASGATIMTINKSAGTFLLYQDLGSSTQGQLIISAALAAGTDEFSNAFKSGFTLYDTGTGGNFIQLNFGNPPDGTVGDSVNTWKFDQSFTTANTHTIGNTTGASNISDVVNIPANHATLGTHYIIEVPLTGVFEGGKFNIGMLVGVTFTNILPSTATAFATGDSFVGTVRFHLQVTSIGATGKANIWCEGTISDATLTRDPTHSMNADGLVSAITFDTTVAQNFAIGWQWSSSIAGQTVTGNSTTVTRKGA